ncbi:putative phospholipase A2 [Citrus sinensis]|uniref:Phospholipase A2 n=1 Tax=Citrus sinensis TaxID=2711 RepID=A0ACB8M2T1_CITSI|nr:putative phospholipase A2 [Citrus sinensis]
MLLGAFVPFRTRVISTLAFVFIIVFSESAGAINDTQVKCSRTCVAENCNSVGIRYGKYCGVGWSGCPREKPCDDLDACYKIHDECVDKKGLTNIKCQENNVRFSRKCPYDTVVPTMVQGMDMAILLSQFWKIIITGKEEFPYFSYACIDCMEIDFRRFYREKKMI